MYPNEDKTDTLQLCLLCVETELTCYRCWNRVYYLTGYTTCYLQAVYSNKIHYELLKRSSDNT